MSPKTTPKSNKQAGAPRKNPDTRTSRTRKSKAKSQDSKGETLESAKNPSTNLLFLLPPELRNQIYDYILSGHTITVARTRNGGFEASIEHETLSPSEVGYTYNVSEDEYALALLLTCREIYDEARPLTYATCTFSFSNSYTLHEFVGAPYSDDDPDYLDEEDELQHLFKVERAKPITFLQLLLKVWDKPRPTEDKTWGVLDRSEVNWQKDRCLGQAFKALPHLKNIEIRATANRFNDQDMACLRALRDGTHEEYPHVEVNAVLLKRVTPYILASRPARENGELVEYVDLGDESDEDSDNDSDD